MIARLCICQACNTVSVQEAEEKAICGKCGGEDVDWTNLDVEELKHDLRDSLVLLEAWGRKEEVQDGEADGGAGEGEEGSGELHEE